MRIAVAQINTRAGDFAKTARRVEELSQTAAEQGADLLVLPMAALTGPVAPDFSNQEGFLLDLSETLVHLCETVACPCVVAMVTSGDDSKPEAMLLHAGDLRPLYPHPLSPSLSPIDKDGDSDTEDDLAAVPSFEVAGLHIALAFTYKDLNDLVDAEESFDVVLYVSAYGYALDDASSVLGAALAENRFHADALALGCWLVGVGSLGGYDLQVYTGSSFVLSPQGELVASAPAFEEALLMADVGAVAQDDALPSLEPEIYNRSLHLWEALSLALHDYLEKIGKSDVALVLDGTLASCTLAALVVDALGPTHVHALVAGAGGDVSSRSVAERIAHSLRIAFEAHDDLLRAAGEDEAFHDDVCQALLARMSREHDALPLGHQDKTFLALEATWGKSSAAALLPFGDVYRSDVLELAHLRNTVSPVIPREAFAAFDVPDLPGLEQEGTQSEMRLQRADVILATHVEWERGLSDVAARQGAFDVAQGVVERLRDTQAARVSLTPYFAMSTRTLFDARMPLGLAWRDRVRTQDERLRKDEVHKLLDALSDARREATLELEDELEERKLAAFLDELEADLAMSGMEGMESLPQGMSRKDIENALGSLFGLLQDLAQTGGLTLGQEGGASGPHGPLTWGSPFSEN